jgi:hypothetical protein
MNFFKKLLLKRVLPFVISFIVLDIQTVQKNGTKHLHILVKVLNFVLLNEFINLDQKEVSEKRSNTKEALKEDV